MPPNATTVKCQNSALIFLHLHLLGVYRRLAIRLWLARAQNKKAINTPTALSFLRWIYQASIRRI